MSTKTWELHRYDAWLKERVESRFQGLSMEEGAQLLKLALSALGEGPHGEIFRKSPERLQHRIAEKKVRRQLGRDLPSFAEWKPKLVRQRRSLRW